MYLPRVGLIAKLAITLLSAFSAATFSQPAASAPLIEIEGRFIIIFGRVFCFLNCDKVVPPPPIVRQPALIPPKPR